MVINVLDFYFLLPKPTVITAKFRFENNEAKQTEAGAFPLKNNNFRRNVTGIGSVILTHVKRG